MRRVFLPVTRLCLVTSFAPSALCTLGATVTTVTVAIALGRVSFFLGPPTGSSPGVSVGGHWCNDFCLPVLGPTRGFCRHQTRVSRGLIWLKSLYNGRNHFVVAGHHLSWHRSRSQPSPTALSYLTIEIPGPCGGGVRLGSRADHPGPHPKSRAYLYKTAIGIFGGLLQPGPNFAGFGGVWCLLSFWWSIGEVWSW